MSDSYNHFRAVVNELKDALAGSIGIDQESEKCFAQIEITLAELENKCNFSKPNVVINTSTLSAS